MKLTPTMKETLVAMYSSFFYLHGTGLGNAKLRVGGEYIIVRYATFKALRDRGLIMPARRERRTEGALCRDWKLTVKGLCVAADLEAASC